MHQPNASSHIQIQTHSNFHTKWSHIRICDRMEGFFLLIAHSNWPETGFLKNIISDKSPSLAG